eukprot:TRINITY_DN1609_c1_g1_i1.p2 TRINITY_DN1609_c1_g1~~TRINITY_DN1609_c1_g1_i1.p2  ORF type:complete len:260 (-),score=41.38 TRINITY_DN1609_c1_g1_i1:630-1409(-)
MKKQKTKKKNRNHDFPNVAVPGPRYEWRADVVRWYNRWLRDEQNHIEDEPAFTLFVRESCPPGPLDPLPGYWRYLPEEFSSVRLYMTSAHELATSLPGTLAQVYQGTPYRASTGTAATDPSLIWWGELLNNMAPLDNDSLVYDYRLTDALEVVGLVNVSLAINSDAANISFWFARLEDYDPATGAVTMVTGASLNSAQRDSSTDPTSMAPHSNYTLSFYLHWTAYAFKAGHHLRIALTNSLYHVNVPSPFQFDMKLLVN